MKIRILPYYVKIGTSANKNNHEHKTQKWCLKWNDDNGVVVSCVYHHFHSTYRLYYFYSLSRCHVTLSAKTSKSFIYDKLQRFMFPMLRSRGVFIWISTVLNRKKHMSLSWSTAPHFSRLNFLKKKFNHFSVVEHKFCEMMIFFLEKSKREKCRAVLQVI